jgi:large subunit ribosomal protein L10
MPMNRQAKESAVEDLSDKLSRAKAALVASYQGLDVAAVNEIRREFRAAGIEYKVVKNTLMKRALAGRSIEALGAAFVGPTAVAFRFDYEAGRLGKVAKELLKKFDKLQIKAGYVEDDVLTGKNVVDTMAALPTLDEARAQLLGLVNAPAAKLLAQLNAPGSHLVGVVKAKQQKDEKGEAV